MILWTAPYATRDPGRLDITRAGCDRLLAAGKPAPGEVLAPSAVLVFPTLRQLKAARTAAERDAVWDGYVVAYSAEQNARERTRAAEYEALLAHERLVGVCFCRDPQRCHRTLAGVRLARLGADYRGEIGGGQ